MNPYQWNLDIMNPPQPPSLRVQQPPAAPPPSEEATGGAPDFSNLDPEQVHRLAMMWGLSDEEAALKLAEERASMLAGTEMPQGRHAGNVFVASNPLEVATASAQRAMGHSRLKVLEGERRDLGKKRVSGASAAYEMYGAKPFEF